jgi:hypothetical protein
MASCSKAVIDEMLENEAADETGGTLYEEMMNAMRSAQSMPKYEKEDVGYRPFSTISSIEPYEEVSAINATVNVDAGQGGAVPRQGGAGRRACVRNYKFPTFDDIHVLCQNSVELYVISVFNMTINALHLWPDFGIM